MMILPDISIILPAYNASMYLREAIDSVLAQSFRNFELIIINDGSTDNTKEIIHSFNDPKIVCIDNIENKGLIYSLNAGISMAKGKYIARMDADDYCVPERLYLQKQLLDQNPEVAFTAGWISFMNEKSVITGYWPLDRSTNTGRSIKRTLLSENCIAHPTVMGRKEIFQQYQYKADQKNLEDYDLWLRVMADGLRIEKVKAVVLHYRIHKASVTETSLKRSNFFFMHFQCKRRILSGQIRKGKFGLYEVRILISMGKDIFMGIVKKVKRSINK